MPAKDYTWNGSKWLGSSGNPDITPPASSARDSLVAGVDKPDGTNTGPYTVGTFTEVNPAGSSTVITVAAGTHYGKRFWGTVKFPDGTIFKECRFPGPDPDIAQTGVGCVQNYGTTPGKAQFFDCKMDPSEWLTVKGRAKMNPYSYGFHGGNVDVWRTEIINVQDPFNWIGPNGTDTTAVTNQSTLVQQCWIHKGYYENDVYPPNDGQPHSDGFQTNYGRNLTLRGNVIGGARNIVGYNTWPGGYNSGDDCWNSALEFEQETSNDANHHIQNVLVELNWLAGGTTTLNFVWSPSQPNTWSDTIIRNNRFMLRGSNWGTKLKADGKGLAPYDATTSNPAGYYVLMGSGIQAQFTGNVIDETGAPVPVSAGA